MNKIKLKSIISEIIKEMVDQHPIHKKINDKLTQIGRRGFDAEENERYVGDPDKGNKILNKANQANIDRILKGEDPIYEGEGVKNIYSKYPYIKDILNAFIYPDGTIGLAIYSSKGGLPVKQTAAIPMSNFTPEYVEKQVSSVYDVDSQFRQGIQQFVDSIHLK